jgi:hypothetical protein
MAGDFRDVLDRQMADAAERLPEGKFKKSLREAGIIGLVLGVLIGNVPVSVAIKQFMSGDYKLDSSALETYLVVFLIVAPYVALAAVATYLFRSGNLPNWPIQGWAVVTAGLVLGSTWLSLMLGGIAPLEAAMGPTNGSPAGLFAYSADSLGKYLEVWGPWPCVAGIVEGFAFGRWAYLLKTSR